MVLVAIWAEIRVSERGGVSCDIMVAAVTARPSPKVAAQGGAHQNPKRPPLLPSEADNGVVGPRRPRSREVTSRYLSSSISSSSSTSTYATSSSNSSSSNSASSRRYASPIVSRTVPMTPMPASSAIKRSQSVERRRPATPRPNTPGNAGEMSAAAKHLVASSRSMSVSFQGESFPLPVSKAKLAPVTNNSSSARKGTPERRKATPIRNQSEHSKPIDQQRWPGRSRQVNSLTRSMDFTAEKKIVGGSGSIVRSLQRSMINETRVTSVDGRLKVEFTNAELDKTGQVVTDAYSVAGSAASVDPVASDAESVSSGSSASVQEFTSLAQVRGGPRGIVVPARFWQETTNRLKRIPEPGSPVSKDNGLKTVGQSNITSVKRPSTDTPISSSRGLLGSRGLSSPLRGAVRPSSPCKLGISSTSSPSRGMPSPSRVRNGVANTVNSNLSDTPSILSFAADVRRGKPGENRIVDAHMLRLLYNRHLQWRFTNARAEAAMLVQRATAEKSLYNAWVTTSKLHHSVKSKKVELQVLRQNLKLYSIIKGLMLFLDDWDIIGRDHSSSLSGATKALEASTVRLPVVCGAKADIQDMKDAICSAVDVMQAMASSICSFMNKAQQANLLISELASISAKEHALIHQCKDLLSSLTAMQAKECSLRTQMLQLRLAPPTPL